MIIVYTKVFFFQLCVLQVSSLYWARALPSHKNATIMEMVRLYNVLFAYSLSIILLTFNIIGIEVCPL